MRFYRIMDFFHRGPRLRGRKQIIRISKWNFTGYSISFTEALGSGKEKINSKIKMRLYRIMDFFHRGPRLRGRKQIILILKWNFTEYRFSFTEALGSGKDKINSKIKMRFYRIMDFFHRGPRLRGRKQIILILK